jgi:ribosomal-protein-alanine N-acetyltransferase
MHRGFSYAVMTEWDLDTVLQIEQALFPHPWSRDFFKLIITDFNNYVITLRKNQTIIGYGGYHLLKNEKNIITPEKDYRRVIHLINIAVTPPFQRRGFGSFLMRTLLRDARSKRAEYCYLEVRPSNTVAYSFYHTFGFGVIGIIESYYPREQEDALVMGLDLSARPL